MTSPSTAIEAPARPLVHEAIDERQHVRIRIPARVTLIRGSQTIACELLDLSIGGMLLRSKQPLEPGTLFDAQLQLQLNAAQLRIEARVTVVSERERTYGVEFTGIEERQRDILRYLIGAQLSGEMADINGLLHILQRENHIKQRKVQPSTTRTLRERLRAVLGSLVFLIAGLLICSLLLQRVYLHFFHVSASQALIDADAYRVAMPENGYVTFLVREDREPVTPGQPIASVSSQLASSIHTPNDLESLRRLSDDDARLLLGRTLIETVIASPCDCEVHFPGRRQDSYLNKDSELLHLLPANEELFVTARFPFERVKDIHRIRSVRLQPLAGASIAGTVIGSQLDSLTEQLVLKIQPEQPLPRDSYQQPLAVDLYLGLPGF
ncbi:MAG TPA: PilZ domain-containing protein [Pseudomonas sp.]|jgi:alginate biosynthesis protein Alg44|nr:PilZ domain-containing protein [Pseudomonas sp.]